MEVVVVVVEVALVVVVVVLVLVVAVVVIVEVSGNCMYCIFAADKNEIQMESPLL